MGGRFEVGCHPRHAPRILSQEFLPVPWVLGAGCGVQVYAGEEVGNREAPLEHRLFKGGEQGGAEVALQELGDLQLMELGDGDTRGHGQPADGNLVLPDDEVLVEERGLVLLVGAFKNLLALLQELGAVVYARRLV